MMTRWAHSRCGSPPRSALRRSPRLSLAQAINTAAWQALCAALRSVRFILWCIYSIANDAMQASDWIEVLKTSGT